MTLFAKEGCKIGPVAAWCWPPKSMRTGGGETGLFFSFFFCIRVKKKKKSWVSHIFKRKHFSLNQDYTYTYM